MNVMISSVSRLVCVFHLCSPAVHVEPPTLTVALNLTFDRSVASTVMMLRVRDEAQAIWHPYGVALRWPDDPRAGAALHLEVIVDRGAAESVDAHPHPELGHTTIGCGGVARGPIHIAIGTIERSVGLMLPPEPQLHDRQLAIATGRVLAHEIGHALLGAPSYHDTEGLMRASFGAGDLAEFDRRHFRLSARSVGRLRARVATLFDPLAADRCA